VTTPGTFDRQVKARRFAALGVPHSWMLDPEARRLECYRNEGGTFVLATTVDGDAVMPALDFDGLTIDLAAL